MKIGRLKLASNVPKAQITDDGVIVPTTSEILNAVLQDYNTAFGGDLNITSTSTPQSILASSLTEAIINANANLAYFVSQIDPSKASGRMQDAIGRIYFLNRKTATPTYVDCLCNGTPGMILPAGATAQDTITGYEYSTDTTYQFGEDGNVIARFFCKTGGAIPCAIGALTKITEYVSGWDAVTNLDVGIVGTPIENRADFEFRRKRSVAQNAHGSCPSMLGTVGELDGVKDVYVLDNPTGQTKFYGSTNYPLKPHSVYVAVVGGDDYEIADAIWRKKDLGCDYNGNTSIYIVDESSHAAHPPTYEVLFNRPNNVRLKFVVTVGIDADLPDPPPDLDQQIKNAIYDTIYGVGSQRGRIAGVVYGATFMCKLSSISQYLLILGVKIQKNATGPLLDYIALGIDEYPTFDINDVQVIRKQV